MNKDRNIFITLKNKKDGNNHEKRNCIGKHYA